MHHLKLKKPLAFFDLETTGINICHDRIVEICIAKAMPNGDLIVDTKKINPGMPIPLESSLIHGIYDEDVKDAPTFKQVAKQIMQFLEGCDLAGFNIIKFDVPLLVEEFLRNGMDFEVRNRKLVDAQKIFHMMEPRNLTAAYKFYCGKDINDLGKGAHSAETDTLATYYILNEQVKRYEGLTVKDVFGNETAPILNDMEALHQLTNAKMVDLAGRIGYNSKGEEIFTFGKHQGKTVQEVFDKEPAFYDWMMKGDFPLDTKKRLTELKLRNFNLK